MVGDGKLKTRIVAQPPLASLSGTVVNDTAALPLLGTAQPRELRIQQQDRSRRRFTSAHIRHWNPLRHGNYPAQVPVVGCASAPASAAAAGLLGCLAQHIFEWKHAPTIDHSAFVQKQAQNQE